MVKKIECDECGIMLPAREAVRTGGKTLCRECMLKDEVPIEVTLVRSSWTPWGEQPVVPVGDLLYPELSGKVSRRKPKGGAALAAAEAAVKKERGA